MKNKVILIIVFVLFFVLGGYYFVTSIPHEAANTTTQETTTDAITETEDVSSSTTTNLNSDDDSVLVQQLKYLYNLSLEAETFDGTYDEWISAVDGPQEVFGDSSRAVRFQVSDVYIQWQYTDEEVWKDLIPLTDIVKESDLDISKSEVNSQGEIIITYTNNETENIGQVINIYTVKFKDYNGYLLDVQVLLYGQSATEPDVPYREGYTFTGWDIDYSNVTTNLELTARYEINTYTVTFKNYDGSVIETKTITHGEVVESPFTIPDREGYLFYGWDVDFSVVTSDLVVTATYIPITYSVMFYGFNGEYLDVQSVIPGEAAIAPNAPDVEGYTFSGWSNDFSSVNTNIEVQALYTINTYTITFNSNGGSNIDSISLNYNAILSILPTPVLEGSNFVGWYSDETLETEFTSARMPLNGVTLYAKWDKITYFINFDPSEGELIESIEVGYLDTITELPTPIRQNYLFEGWYLNDTLVSTFDYTYNHDITLKAKWVGLYNGLLFTDNGTGITIDGYRGSETSIVIPDKINNVNVTHIADNAFKDNETITSITLGQFVTNIGNQAFYGMNELTYIAFPAATTNISSEILLNSNKLETFVISSEATHPLAYYYGNNISNVPDSLNLIKFASGSTVVDRTLFINDLSGAALELADDCTEITSNMFWGLTTLTKIIIPSGVTSIGENAFYMASNLAEVIFKENSSLTTIYENAFYSCSSLTSITIPKSVTIIGISAFNRTSSLTSVTFEENSELTRIENYAFQLMGNVTKIVIPKGVTFIGFCAFSNNLSLKEVVFEENSQLEYIDEYAFANDDGLTDFILPDSLMYISANAFAQSNNIKRIIIPISVISIQADAFKYCTDLTIYTESTTNQEYWDSMWNSSNQPVVYGILGYGSTEDFNYVITSDNTITITSQSISSVNTNLVIPETINGLTVTKIQASAFYRSTSFTSIVIPDTVSVIGVDAFGFFTGTVYAVAATKPVGWDNNCFAFNTTVVWGYTPE